MAKSVKCGCAYFDDVDMSFLLLPESLLAFIRSPIAYIKTWLLYTLLNVLATGPIPRHIAFEMDGNRRYARRLGKEGKDGHPDGFKNLLWVCSC